MTITIDAQETVVVSPDTREVAEREMTAAEKVVETIQNLATLHHARSFYFEHEDYHGDYYRDAVFATRTNDMSEIEELYRISEVTFQTKEGSITSETFTVTTFASDHPQRITVKDGVLTVEEQHDNIWHQVADPEEILYYLDVRALNSLARHEQRDEAQREAAGADAYQKVLQHLSSR